MLKMLPSGTDATADGAEAIYELTLISLRFRPYVQKATYYQFLKGAYFDSTLVTLSNWPTTALPTLSVVQDPLDPTIAPDHFAQPLVFFELQPLGSLALSPLAADLTSFRLRIPGRKVAQYLYALPRTLPRVELLDLSTCNVLDTDIEGILGRFGHLKALVLDGCAVVSQRADILGQAEPTSQWAALGKTMALAGVKRAREREKKVKAWREAGYAALPTVAEPAPAQQAAPRRFKRGRRGLATATISLRASPSRDNEVPAQAVSVDRLPPPSQKIRILPFSPILQSIALTTPSAVGPEMHGAIREEFERGWAEGIAQLSAIRARLRQSWRNGVRVLMFSEEIDDEIDEVEGDSEVGLTGRTRGELWASTRLGSLARRSLTAFRYPLEGYDRVRA
ncbi:hypothetical protein A0H81_11642 [Grifola frondosa]|uniref:Uncharacterized protein n=1 Tax=Grifola frondosa TaxID=5627 RepID=A0A1C7LUN2_GRIFR|nr:hypothetical protein A0H81_11642 [Grifola frondosa]